MASRMARPEGELLVGVRLAVAAEQVGVCRPALDLRGQPVHEVFGQLVHRAIARVAVGPAGSVVLDVAVDVSDTVTDRLSGLKCRTRRPASSPALNPLCVANNTSKSHGAGEAVTMASQARLKPGFTRRNASPARGRRP